MGVDAITLTSGDHWEKCGSIAEAENRIILTRPRRERCLSDFVPQGHCYALKADRPSDQMVEVFRQFHVKQSKDYIFRYFFFLFCLFYSAFQCNWYYKKKQRLFGGLGFDLQKKYIKTNF